MTKREFYEAIMNGIVNEETEDFARAELERLDAQAAKRAEKSAEKAATFNAEVTEAMAGLEFEGAITASQVGEQLGVSVQKASSIMRRAVDLGLATVEDIKISGKGKVKGYTLAD